METWLEKLEEMEYKIKSVVKFAVVSAAVLVCLCNLRSKDYYEVVAVLLVFGFYSQKVLK